MAVHRLTKTDARRIAVRAQLLDASRPTDLLELVGRLTFLQLDGPGYCEARFSPTRARTYAWD